MFSEFIMLPISRPLGFLFLCAALALSSGLSTPAHAQALTIGSPNVAVADPLVPRPPSTPCAVNLFSNQQFADFSSKPFSYAPPAACPGPWQKVVLSADFNVTAGRQFDRTGEIWLGGAVIYFGTTQEPSATVAPSWHIERDLTDYSALFATAAGGHTDLGNFVGVSGGVTYDGIIYGSATLYFYPVVPDDGDTSLAPRPDAVLPVTTSSSGGTATLVRPADQLSVTFTTLPTNIERAYLDVYAQGQYLDEFWFFDLPDDIAPLFFDTGSTAFKETLVTIDGAPAGIAPIYPWIFTGGADPILWRPIPGVQTLAFEPYRVDLTPFVGVLDDGNPHTLALSVYNAANYFSAAANLLLYQDHGSSTVTGAVTANTLNATPVVNVNENVVSQPDGSAAGSVSVTSNRAFSIAGTANTSHGLVTTQIDTTIAFSSVQQLAISDTVYSQDTVQNTNIDATTTRTAGKKASVVHEQRSYPLTFDYDDVFAADGTETLHTLVDQEFKQQVDAGVRGNTAKTAKRDNHVVSTVTRHYDADGNLVSTPATASQTYTYADPFGACYSRKVSAQDRLLSAVADGAGCPGGHNHLTWHDQFAYFVSAGWGATVKLLP
jgi:hypothetical protein